MSAPPRAAATLCSDYRWACAASGNKASPGPQAVDHATRVSRRINRTTRNVADDVQYRKADHWTLPSRRGGDCEDIALLKKRELVRQGLAPERLLLSTVLDTGGNSHAVLVLRTEEGDYVIDNLRDSVRLWNQTGYTFLRMQDPSAPRRWIRLNVKG